jgi:hypothetical protein
MSIGFVHISHLSPRSLALAVVAMLALSACGDGGGGGVSVTKVLKMKVNGSANGEISTTLASVKVTNQEPPIDPAFQLTKSCKGVTVTPTTPCIFTVSVNGEKTSSVMLTEVEGVSGAFKTELISE